MHTVQTESCRHLCIIYVLAPFLFFIRQKWDREVLSALRISDMVALGFQSETGEVDVVLPFCGCLFGLRQVWLSEKLLLHRILQTKISLCLDAKHNVILCF